MNVPATPTTDLTSRLFTIFNIAHKDVGLDTVRVLLYVAQHEGLTQAEYGKALDSSQSSISRHLSMLGQVPFRVNQGREIVKPLKFLEIRQPEGQRVGSPFYLSAKGREFIQTLIHVMKD